MARQPIPWPARLSADRTARARTADAAALEAGALELELVAMARMAYAELWGLETQAARIAEYADGIGPEKRRIVPGNVAKDLPFRSGRRPLELHVFDPV
jgi:hypothetical protein